MEKNKSLILILLLIIVILLGIVVFILIIRPTIEGYIIRGQDEGIRYAVYTIMESAANCQEVPLILENRTMNVISADCFGQVYNTEENS